MKTDEQDPDLYRPVTHGLLQSLWLLENSGGKRGETESTDKRERNKLFLAHLWYKSRGRLPTICQVAFLWTIAVEESFRKDTVTGFMNALQLQTLYIGCLVYMLAYSFYDHEFVPILRDLVWVSEQLEPLATVKARRECERVMKFSRIVFWAFFASGIGLLALMAASPMTTSSFPLGHPLPDPQEVGVVPAKLLTFIGWAWEMSVSILLGMTCTWTDGLHCASLLAMTSLLRMLRLVMENSDFDHSQSATRVLVQCHQKLLIIGDQLNSILGVPLFVGVLVNSVMVIVSCYCVLFSRLYGPGFIAASASTGTVVFTCIISEILVQGNADIGESIYRSDWITPLFSKSVSKHRLQLNVVMVQVRASRPLCVKPKFMTGLNYAFLLAYFKTVYTYMQALFNFM